MNLAAFDMTISSISGVGLPVRVPAETSVQVCLEKMQTSNIGCLIIGVDSIEGIFTERDYLTKIAGCNVGPTEAINKFMVKKPITVKGDDLISDAIKLMRKGKFRHLPVVDHKGKLQSVLSIKDIVYYVSDFVLT